MELEARWPRERLLEEGERPGRKGKCRKGLLGEERWQGGVCGFVQLSRDAEEPSRPEMSHFILKHEFGKLGSRSSSVRPQSPGREWACQWSVAPRLSTPPVCLEIANSNLSRGRLSVSTPLPQERWPNNYPSVLQLSCMKPSLSVENYALPFFSASTVPPKHLIDPSFLGSCREPSSGSLLGLTAH